MSKTVPAGPPTFEPEGSNPGPAFCTEVAAAGGRPCLALYLAELGLLGVPLRRPDAKKVTAFLTLERQG